MARELLNIDVNVPAVVMGLNHLAHKQVPFATSLALNWTANEARDEVKGSLSERFTLRSTWVERGIRSQPSTKRRLRALVYSRDEFMGLQETGGTKRARGGGRIALPRGIRRTARERITPAKRPKRVLEKANTFEQPIPGGRGASGIYRRVGRKGQLRLLYVLDPRPMRIKPRLGLEETTNRVIRRRFNRNFGRALGRALRTAR